MASQPGPGAVVWLGLDWLGVDDGPAGGRAGPGGLTWEGEISVDGPWQPVYNRALGRRLQLVRTR